MGNRFAKLTCILVLGLTMSGCSNDETDPRSNAYLTTNKDIESVSKIGARIGIVLSSSAVVLYESDGGGRDASYGFYEWIIFSSTEIKMPFFDAVGIPKYMDRPLMPTLSLVQDRIPKHQILDSEKAFLSEWKMNGYTFRGVIVRTTRGDYLFVQQFRDK